MASQLKLSEIQEHSPTMPQQDSPFSPSFLDLGKEDEANDTSGDQHWNKGWDIESIDEMGEELKRIEDSNLPLIGENDFVCSPGPGEVLDVSPRWDKEQGKVKVKLIKRKSNKQTRNSLWYAGLRKWIKRLLQKLGISLAIYNKPSMIARKESHPLRQS
jgi:hypothetical protein